MNQRILYLSAWAGLLGVGLSSAAILFLAALRTDGYNHLHKAVSELGSNDAPNKWLFNVLGYILPGLLIAVCANGLRRYFSSRPWPFWTLMASGVCMTLAGLFPMDMHDRTTLSSTLHTIGSLGSGLCWIICALTVKPALQTSPRWTIVARYLPWLPLLVFGLMLVVPPTMPGLVQRISFIVYFVFVGLLANKLRQLTRNTSVPQLT